MIAPKSLQGQLYKWIIISALALLFFGGLIAGILAFKQARELQDNTLKEISLLVKGGLLDLTNFKEFPENDWRDHQKSEKRHKYLDHDHDDDADNDEEETTIIIHELDKSNQLPGLSPNIKDGLKTIRIHDDGWRVLTITQKDTKRRFSIAQPTELRNEIALSSSVSTLLPLLFLVTFMLLVIHIIMRRQFKPLKKLAKNLDHQDGTQLTELSGKNIPLEVVPFVDSINALISRVKQAMQKQQRFIADAAHELRTPITALSLQADNLKNVTDATERTQRYDQLQKGFERLGKLVAQLLDLARLQNKNSGIHTNNDSDVQIVSFNDIVNNAIADLHPLVEKAELDIGMLRQDAEIFVKDQNGILTQLIQNAIANAIHYTPANGIIDISLFKENGNAVFLVEDTGIGIPENELNQVMQPFYRVLDSGKPGNGLGLTISQEIAQSLKGKIQLTNRKECGLCFRYEQALAKTN